MKHSCPGISTCPLLLLDEEREGRLYPEILKHQSWYKWIKGGSKSNYIGIDFGTTNCVVSNFRYGRVELIKNSDGDELTPSMVKLSEDGRLICGRAAKEDFQEGRTIRSVKRILGAKERIKLGEEERSPEWVATALFSKIKRDTERDIREDVTKVVITIPANSKGPQRYATKLCAGMVGMQVMTLINEPMAAAMSYGINIKENQRILVYDFGGGTFDVTILRIFNGIFEELASKGIKRLGGDDIDKILMDYLSENFKKREGIDLRDNKRSKWRLILECEKAKIQLSQEDEVAIIIPNIIEGAQIHLNEVISRSQFEGLIYGEIEKTREAIEIALEMAKLTPKDIDKVVLVGGSSKIPLVSSFVTKIMGKSPEPIDNVDPLTCVAEGAAIASAILQDAPGLDGYDYLVRLEHSLCTDPLDDRLMVHLDPIIKRGTEIPFTNSKVYYPVYNLQEEVLIGIYEGDNYNNPGSDENVKLGELKVSLSPPRPVDESAIEINYHYGEDGILKVTAKDVSQGKEYKNLIDYLKIEGITEEEQQNIKNDISKMMKD